MKLLCDFAVPRKQSSQLVEVALRISPLLYGKTQKPLFTDIFQNRCFENYCKFHWKTSVL